MAKFLFVISDFGNTWKITTAKVEPDDNFTVDPDLYYETPSQEFHDFIKTLLETNEVLYLKNFENAKLIVDSAADDSDLIFQAVAPGAPGDNVGVVLAADAPNQSLQVDLSGGIVTVSLATDGSSVPLSTASDVATAVAAYAPAAAIINTVLRGTGTGVVDAIPETYLTGGAAGDDELTQEDIITIPYDTLTISKARTRTLGKHLMKQRVDLLILFDFFQFSINNNLLVNAGYVITDDNREAKYLEVINTGDQDLIAALETYLEARDRIGEHMSWYTAFLEFKDNVNNSVDQDEIDAAYGAFAVMFA